MLADLVKAGKLPPVEQRLPPEPMVLKPVHEIGKYGGTMRRAFTGPADGENVNRVMATDKLLFVDYTGIKIVPSVARDFKLEDGGKTTTLFLRKGMKWSDGQPFTADDIIFWFEDLYSNKELTPTPAPEFSINGKPGKFVKIDDLTVQAQFPEPYPMFVDVLAGFTTVGSGLALGGGGGGWWRRQRAGTVRAGPLPEAVPPEVRDARSAGRGPQDRRRRQLGDLDQEPQRLPDQRRLSRPDPLADDHPRTIRPTGCSSETRISGRSTPTATSCPTSTNGR